jgi:hypothetical protein
MVEMRNEARDLAHCFQLFVQAFRAVWHACEDGPFAIGIWLVIDSWILAAEVGGGTRPPAYR